MAEKMYVHVNGERVQATGALLEEILANRAEAQAERAEELAKAEAEALAKASAIAKLEALGLTVDEVSAAFGLEA